MYGHMSLFDYRTMSSQQLGQSFFIFRFTDPPDPIFWKLKKKYKRFFSILFLYFPPSSLIQLENGPNEFYFYFISYSDTNLLRKKSVKQKIKKRWPYKFWRCFKGNIQYDDGL